MPDRVDPYDHDVALRALRRIAQLDDPGKAPGIARHALGLMLPVAAEAEARTDEKARPGLASGAGH